MKTTEIQLSSSRRAIISYNISCEFRTKISQNRFLKFGFSVDSGIFDAKIFFIKNYILTTKIVVILFERFSDDTVEIFYRNGTDENHFFTLTEKTCGTYNCTLSDLQVAWKPVIPTVIHFP